MTDGPRRSVAGGDIAYRMQTLTYRPVETGLDDGVPLATLVRLFVWAWAASFLVSAVVFVFFEVVYLLSPSDPEDNGLPHSGPLLIWVVLTFVAFWLVLLAARIDEPIAEWKTLLEDRFAAADSAYAAIYGTLRGRGIPVDAAAERVRGEVLGRSVVNNRLVLTERSYTVFVSVFPYGTSLYTGWTMSRRRRGAIILGHFFKDLFGRAGGINELLRAERVRAMLEAVHAAVREGAETAVQGIDVPITAAFGQDLPVRDLSASADQPPMPPAPPAPTGPAGPGTWGGDPPTWPGNEPNAWAPPAPGPQAAPSPQPAPAQSSSAQPTPAQPSSAQPTPAQPGPVQPTPVQPTPVQPGPVQPGPAAGRDEGASGPASS